MDNNPFDYNDADDGEVYITPSSIALMQVVVRISACTLAGDAAKANEDTFAITVGDKSVCMAVFDGTTSLQPLRTLEALRFSGARFASHFLRDAFRLADKAAPLNELLVWLNSELGIKTKDLVEASAAGYQNYPASTGTMVRLDTKENRLELAHVGDSFCIVYFRDGLSHLLTTNQNELFDQQVFDLIRSISEERQIVPREARQDARVERKLIEMAQLKCNNPTGVGCGLINGDERVKRYIEHRALPLSDVAAVLIGSDGLIPQGWFVESERCRADMYEALQAGGLQRLVDMKRYSEDTDPDWRHIRYKHSDDATGIFAELAQ
jgi:serine/threonine protein phosphatase PrpC